jgi:hypothetical protein
MNERRPRVMVSVQPRLFGEALARVLRHQFEVVDADASSPPDVAVATGPAAGDACGGVWIHLPAADGAGGVAEVVTADGAQRVCFTGLADLVDVIRRHATPPVPAA